MQVKREVIHLAMRKGIESVIKHSQIQRVRSKVVMVNQRKTRENCSEGDKYD